MLSKHPGVRWSVFKVKLDFTVAHWLDASIVQETAPSSLVKLAYIHIYIYMKSTYQRL